jgi:outer membrane protein OmpA-like peptidoglycan-associated protein
MKTTGILVVLGTALAGCTSAPPAPPAPDEATRRPVNSGLGIELQACKASLAGARLALEEDARAAERLLVAAPPGASGTAGGRTNTVYIVPFRYAEHEIRLAEEDVQRLVADAKAAVSIQVRGRTDALRENSYDNALAAGRANAVMALLMRHGVDPAKVRLTYQGQGDGISPYTDEKNRALNRRAEVEIYRLPVEVVILANRRAP